MVTPVPWSHFHLPLQYPNRFSFRLALPNLSVVILVFLPMHVSCTFPNNDCNSDIVLRVLKRTVSSSNFPPSRPPASNISADNNYSSISSTFPVLISLSPLSNTNCAIPFTPNSFHTVGPYVEFQFQLPSMAKRDYSSIVPKYLAHVVFRCPCSSLPMSEQYSHNM